MGFKREIYSTKNIKKIIEQENLLNYDNLKRFVIDNINDTDINFLSKIIELSNNNRINNSAYFTNKEIVDSVVSTLPNFDSKKEINIIEPSVGIGNFLPRIFQKYKHIEKVNLTLIDIDNKILELLKIIVDKIKPNNFKIKYICCDYLKYNFENVDLIIGNPPFTKMTGNIESYLENNYNKQTKNLAEFFLEKSIRKADYVSLILPKNILNTPEYQKTRELLLNHTIEEIHDFGELGFDGVKIETINILISNRKQNKIKIHNHTLNKLLEQKKQYITDSKLPYWVIYRDKFFDKVFEKLEFNIFDVFRDRQLTNKNIIKDGKEKNIRVLKARNITKEGIINIENYDAYIDENNLKKYTVYKFLNNNRVYLTPNMTYNPRLIKKEKGYIVNGSVAILIPKKEIELTKTQLDYIASDEYRQFYKIARNYQTRSLNIDKSSCFWFGKLKGE